MVLSISVAALVTLSRVLGWPGPMILFRRVPRSDRLRPISNHSHSTLKGLYAEEVFEESQKPTQSRTCPFEQGASQCSRNRYRSQWLQQLHTIGMLRGSFRPQAQMCVVRSYLRLRDTLSKDCNSLVQRMQKALTEMNLQIHRVISDITGLTGMNILRAIVAGERDCVKLAQLKHPQIRSSAQQIAKALEGDYCPEHLCALQTALELYDSYQLKIMQCDKPVFFFERRASGCLRGA